MKTKYVEVYPRTENGEPGYVGVGDTAEAAVKALDKDYSENYGGEIPKKDIVIYASCRYGTPKITVEIVWE